LSRARAQSLAKSYRGGAEERKEILHKNEERILWSTDLKKTVEEFER
jgi:hypothetical protein